MKILVIEDEQKIANSIKKGLELEKFIADVAYDGEAGLDLAITEKYDCIILDRMLPKIDGTAILKEIRAKKIHTPVIFLTARGQLMDKVEGLNLGADDYMVKPFSFIELLARIKALTRRPTTNKDHLLIVKDLSINLDSFEVKRNEKVINLSKKEYLLLEYLMHRPNQTISKEQIISQVWNYESDVLPNSVEVFIKHIRDKLGKPNLIETKRGFGYRIKGD